MSVRPFILTLFCLLVLSRTASAARLVLLVPDGGEDDGVPLTASRLLVAPGRQSRFHDYLLLAFNSAIAFSPADRLPLNGRVTTVMAGCSRKSATAPHALASQSGSGS